MTDQIKQRSIGNEGLNLEKESADLKINPKQLSTLPNMAGCFFEGWGWDGVAYVKCSDKASGVRFADGKKSRRLSSILPRFRIEMRSSRLLSTRYSLKKSVINDRTSPLATRLSLSNGWRTVSGGRPDNFWEKASAVKIASFFLSSSSKSSNDCKNFCITFSRFFMRKGLLLKSFCKYITDGKMTSRVGSHSSIEYG